MPSKADILSRLRADIASVERGGVARGSAGSDGEGARLPFARGPQVPSQRSCPRYTPSFAPEGLGAGAAGGCDGRPEPQKTADEAFQKILRWVSVRERSSAYLRERLLRDEFAPEAAEEALARACRVHAVDDRRYADALIRMRLAAGKGLRDAECEIDELGIDPATLDSWAEHHEQGREAEVARALALLRRRPPRAKQVREAAFRKLVSQGYGTDVAATAARQWAEECGQSQR